MCGSRHILPGSSLGAVSTFGIAIIGAEWRACKLPLLGVIVRNLPWHAATNELLQQINLAAPLSLSLSLQSPFSPSLRLWLCFSFHFAFVSLKISTRKWRRRRISARFLEHPIKSQINVMTTTKMSISDKRDNTSQQHTNRHTHTQRTHTSLHVDRFHAYDMNESNKSSQVNSDLLHHVPVPVAHMAIATLVLR